MADLSWIGANMLEYLKALSRRSVAPAESEAADSGAVQLIPRHQSDLLQFILDNMAEGGAVVSSTLAAPAAETSDRSWGTTQPINLCERSFFPALTRPYLHVF